MTARVLPQPTPKARAERQLVAKWARETALLAELRKLREEIRPLQGEVSREHGYGFTVSRENLELSIKAREGRARTTLTKIMEQGRG